MVLFNSPLGEVIDFPKKKTAKKSSLAVLNLHMVELGGFEPPSTSLFHPVLHV